MAGTLVALRVLVVQIRGHVATRELTLASSVRIAQQAIDRVWRGDRVTIGGHLGTPVTRDRRVLGVVDRRDPVSELAVTHVSRRAASRGR